MISATLLKINSIMDSQAVFLDFKENYLPNNHVTAVSVALKRFVAPGGRKYVEYFALGLTLKGLLGTNHATRT